MRCTSRLSEAAAWAIFVMHVVKSRAILLDAACTRKPLDFPALWLFA